MDLAEITGRLAVIDELLDGEFSKASDKHFALLTERDELRKAASKYWTKPLSGVPTHQLESLLAELRTARKMALKSNTGFITSKGGSNQGPASGAWIKLGAQALSASGVDKITRRISAIEDEIAARQASAG